MRVPPPPPSSASAVAAAVRAASAPALRWYQADLKDRLYQEWPTHKNVLAVLPTGGGKTVFFAAVVGEHHGGACCIAHRQELVAQISMALARNGIRHRIVAPEKVVRAIAAQHVEELGVNYVWSTAPVGVAGVDTLLKRGKTEHGRWLEQVTLWVQDEAHHVLRGNKWGSAADLFPNAKGLGVTATPCRADGKGLGAHADGVFHTMIVGPTMRYLIDSGYLTDYRIVVAETHIDLAGVNTGKDGDWVLDRGKGKAAVRGSTLIGDVVTEYQKWTPGKLAVCFTSDTDTAEDIAAQYRAAGVPAEAVDGNTPDDQRRAALKRFKNRQTLVLVNCDLFGEGFDLPAIEVVQLARKTQSFSLHAQQFGRALRLMIERALMAQWDTFTDVQRLAAIAGSGKPHAWIIDHVGNICNPALGLPDARNDWTLDRRDKRASKPNDAIQLTACLNPVCMAPYERAKPCCPFCGWKPEPRVGARSPVEAVDGNMFELPPEALAALRGAVATNLKSNDQVRRELLAQGLPSKWIMGQVKHHDAKLQAAEDLRDAMEWWAGERRSEGQSDAEVMKRFYLTFGVDWLTARAGDRAAMAGLTERIDEKLTPASSALRVRATG